MINQWQLDHWTKIRLEQEIQLMKDAIESYKRNGQYGQDDRTAECEIRIFNAAINLGDFDLAREYAKTPAEATLLIRLLKAFARGEHDACKCVPDVIPGNIELPLFFNWRRIYNRDAGVWIDVYRCSKCNFATTNANAVCVQAARNLERVKSKPENNGKNKLKDHEVFRQ